MERKFTIFALFYFVFEGKYQVQAPPGGLYSEGRFNGGFFCVTILGGLYLEGLIRGGAYFRNFTVTKNTNALGIEPLLCLSVPRGGTIN